MNTKEFVKNLTRNKALYWSIYTALVIFYSYFIYHLYPSTAKVLFSWVAWSGYYQNIWELYLVSHIPFLLVSPFNKGAKNFTVKILIALFFVLLIKLNLVAGLYVYSIKLEGDYGNFLQSSLSVLYVVLLIFMLSNEKLKNGVQLVYLVLLSILVAFQLIEMLRIGGGN